MTHRTTRIAGALIGAAALAALAACSPPAATSPAADTSKDVAAIKAAEAQFNADYKARAADKLAAGNTADVIGYVPFAPAQKGPGDAKFIAADFTADPALSVTLTPDRVEVAKSGDLGYAVGHFERDATNPKTHAVEHGTGGYVTVYRKQADGTWKPAAYAASPGPPAPGPAAKP
jgi:ketosteroid isomerase-like protein